MSRTENASRNVIWGLLNSITSIFMPFVTRTALIYVLGVEYVGLSSLFTSILQVLSFTELGIGTALVYSMYAPIANGENDKVCALLNFYRKAYRVIGIIVLFLGVCILPFLQYLIKSDIPADINIYILYCVYLANNVVSYLVFPEKASLLLACQRADLNSRVTIFIKLFQSIFQVIAIISFKSYYPFVILLPIFTAIHNLISARIANRLYPHYFCEGNVESSHLNSIKKNVGGMVFQKIGNIVLSSVDTLVISTFLGLKVLGIYNGYLYIITALFGVLSTIQIAIIPSVGNSMVSSSKKKNYGDFKIFNYLYTWIVIWCSTCLLCLIQPFMEIWVGQELMLDNNLALLFVVYFFFFKWMDMINVYREASGIWWQGRYYPIVAAGVNLITNIILVNIIGLPGILLSTIICLVTIHDTWGVVILKKYYFKKEMNLKEYYFKQLLYFLAAVVVAGVTYAVCSRVLLSPLYTLLVRGLLCIIVPNILLFSMLRWINEHKEAKAFVINIIKRKMKKNTA